jgi:hypothetical protein
MLVNQISCILIRLPTLPSALLISTAAQIIDCQMLNENREFVENLLVCLSRTGIEDAGLLERLRELEKATKGRDDYEFVYLNCRSILMGNERC